MVSSLMDAGDMHRQHSTLLQAEVKRAELEQQRDALQQRRQLLATTVQERNRLHDVKQRTLEQHDMYVQLQRLEQQIRTLNQVSSGMCFLKQADSADYS